MAKRHRDAFHEGPRRQKASKLGSDSVFQDFVGRATWNAFSNLLSVKHSSSSPPRHNLPTQLKSPFVSTMIQALSTATANAVEPKMKDEQLSVDTETDSNTSSSYTDDEASPRGMSSPNGLGTGVWTKEEHARFLEAIKIYANGPWKLVASYVGTRTVRQTMTHAQKYRQKAARRLRGLRTKQALMRMHFGHHVSEESLMQERLRSMGQNNYRCEPIPVSYATTASYQRNSFQSELSSEATPWSFPESTVYPDATMLEVDLIEGLISSPSLEECATELLKLLF